MNTGTNPPLGATQPHLCIHAPFLLGFPLFTFMSCCPYLISFLLYCEPALETSIVAILIAIPCQYIFVFNFCISIHNLHFFSLLTCCPLPLPFYTTFPLTHLLQCQKAIAKDSPFAFPCNLQPRHYLQPRSPNSLRSLLECTVKT